MVHQALSAGAPVEQVFIRDAGDKETEATTTAAAKAGVPTATVSRGIFVKLLDLGYETSAGVAASVRVPPRDTAGVNEPPPPLCLAGESIQDPRNVGVLIRTADAYAVPFHISADSAFAWSRQSVRSSTGSIFRVRCTVEEELGEWLESVKQRGVAVVGTSAHAEARLNETKYPFPCVLLIGNESAGISERVRSMCDVVVSIPMYGSAHSLNVTVAAGIALHEVARQRMGSRPDRRDSRD